MALRCDDEADLYPPIVYGIATYYGGYGLSGDDLPTLKAQFRDFLETKPDTNFLEEFRKERKSSVQRHFSHFVMSAFLCEQIAKLYGEEVMINFARSGRSGELFFEHIEKLLGYSEKHFHKAIVALIQE